MGMAQQRIERIADRSSKDRQLVVHSSQSRKLERVHTMHIVGVMIVGLG